MSTKTEAMPEKITLGEKYGPAMTITDKAEAAAYFERCVEHSMTKFGKTRHEAETIERANLGYYAGYYDSATRARVERLFACAHPVFGAIERHGEPSALEAFGAGVRRAVCGPAMSQYRKKPVVVEATQWFKNGDHPLDNAPEMFDYPNGSRPRVIREGEVVRYYRNPDVAGGRLCHHESCKQRMEDHGWIDTLEGGHIACPGDFIITGVKGERYPCKPDIFAATYEAVS